MRRGSGALGLVQPGHPNGNPNRAPEWLPWALVTAIVAASSVL